MWSWGWGRRREEEGPLSATPPVEYRYEEGPIRSASLVPMRLTMHERKIQRLMRGIMQASSYTDKVDSDEAVLKNKRVAEMMKELPRLLQGLILGISLEHGAKLCSRDKAFVDYKKDFVVVVENCRRYKIMNPDLLRTDYVKFLYMLQDAVSPEIQDQLGFNLIAPVVTVESWLKECGIESLLKDPRLPLCITPVPKIQDRTKLNAALRYKDRLVNAVCAEYAKKAAKEIKESDIEVAIRSLNDLNTFSDDHVVSTTKLLDLLIREFPKGGPIAPQLDLGIAEGQHGSRLTHEHSRQYMFVLQSLSLWKNIAKKMFALWMLAESDLLNPQVPYTFRKTGQGHQRVQPAPTLFKAITDILEETKRELGSWIGSERIHMGDDQVPNAFHFIDKYGQIARIIIPILRTVDNVDELEKDPHRKKYLEETYGGARGAKITVLRDFFRHGFDGSGGDNMDDAGSCIDGRLTSAWNWCNGIHLKPFYPLFLFAGFTSFDGDMAL